MGKHCILKSSRKSATCASAGWYREPGLLGHRSICHAVRAECTRASIFVGMNSPPCPLPCCLKGPHAISAKRASQAALNWAAFDDRAR
jgi:hypothetical protein